MDQYQGYAYWWRITGSAGGLRSTEPPPSQLKLRNMSLCTAWDGSFRGWFVVLFVLLVFLFGLPF